MINEKLARTVMAFGRSLPMFIGGIVLVLIVFAFGAALTAVASGLISW